MDFKSIYESKLITPEAAATLVKSGDWVDYGWSAATTYDMDMALAARMPELYDIKVRGGVLVRKPAIFDVPDAGEHFTWNSWHMSGFERKAPYNQFCYYSPMRYSELPRLYRDMPQDVDVAVFQVSPMDKHGYFSFGASPSHQMEVCRRAKIVIAEVNKNMPRCLGGYDNGISVENVDYIIEGESPEMPQIGGSAATDIDRAVAKLVVEQIPNGACLQLGIGGMPNAIGAALADSDLKDLGVHTEMYVDAFVDMTMAGRITGQCKNIDRGRQTFAFAAGSQKLYDFIDDNPAMMGVPVEYANDARVICQLDNFISINNAIDIDLSGQVNAESAGTRPISGAGGQQDFVLGAYLSNGGKSFICLSSCFMNKKTGKMESRIRPTLVNGSIVTDTRANTDYIVTEYGMAHLKGMTAWQRAEALINIAHPDFREELIAEAEKIGIWRKSNKR